MFLEHCAGWCAYILWKVKEFYESTGDAIVVRVQVKSFFYYKFKINHPVKKDSGRSVDFSFSFWWVIKIALFSGFWSIL